jgi:hypothetical protein
MELAWADEHGVFTTHFVGIRCIVDTGSSNILLPRCDCLGCDEAAACLVADGRHDSETVAFGTETMRVDKAARTVQWRGQPVRVRLITHATGPGLGILGIGPRSVPGTWSLSSTRLAHVAEDWPVRGKPLLPDVPYLAFATRVAERDMRVIVDCGCTRTHSNVLSGRVAIGFETIEIDGVEDVADALDSIYGRLPFLVIGARTIIREDLCIFWNQTHIRLCRCSAG